MVPDRPHRGARHGHRLATEEAAARGAVFAAGGAQGRRGALDPALGVRRNGAVHRFLAHGRRPGNADVPDELLLQPMRYPMRRFFRVSLHRQKGFTLVEVAIVAAIVLIAAIVGIPAINGYIIENKVPAVAQELQRFIARTKASSQGLGTTPYAGIGIVQLANALRGSSVVTVSGAGAAAIVRHGLGASDGRIVLAAGTMTSAGDAF